MKIYISKFAKDTQRKYLFPIVMSELGFPIQLFAYRDQDSVFKQF
ncbi:hypothetical protein LV84_02983 [Algoriphagus ratkowskyi]|uniref:Uncharacterized protein n=1 Tax=Algoriphagus ratkowskyi TaxID=57028 RepID=A0A2W7RSP9_9BACT|nr:hypothetical protein [Algoriphagus ratkowskyi]PZX53875.1 hypothetical protein LV84_02983 [Algoriphagus ratkowskyi]